MKPGGLKREMLLGEPVLIGRDRNGAPFAMRDICPHRAVPLSAGKMLDDNTVECPYHGWRFRTDGVCALIPSTVSGQTSKRPNIRVRSYPVREQDGLIWVWMAEPGHEKQLPKSEPPKVGVPTPRRAGRRASCSAAASTMP